MPGGNDGAEGSAQKLLSESKKVDAIKHVNASEFMADFHATKEEYLPGEVTKESEAAVKLFFQKNSDLYKKGKKGIPIVIPNLSLEEKITTPKPPGLSYKDNKKRTNEIKDLKDRTAERIKKIGEEGVTLTDYTAYITKYYRDHIKEVDPEEFIKEKDIGDITSIVFEPDMFKPEFFGMHFDHVLAKMKHYDLLAKEFCYDKDNPDNRYDELDEKGRAAVNRFEKIYKAMQVCFQTALRVHNIYFQNGFKEDFGEVKVLCFVKAKPDQKLDFEKKTPRETNDLAIEELKKIIKGNDTEVAYEVEASVESYVKEKRRERFEDKAEDYQKNYPLVKGVFMDRASCSAAQRYLSALDDRKTVDRYKANETAINRALRDFILLSERQHQWRLRDESYLVQISEIHKQFKGKEKLTPGAEQVLLYLRRGLVEISAKREMYKRNIDKLRRLLDKAIFAKEDDSAVVKKLWSRYGFKQIAVQPDEQDEQADTQPVEQVKQQDAQPVEQVKQQDAQPVEQVKQLDAEAVQQLAQHQDDLPEQVKQQMIRDAKYIKEEYAKKEELFRDALESYFLLNDVKVNDFDKVCAILRTEPFRLLMKDMSDEGLSEEESDAETIRQPALIELSILANIDKLEGLVENLTIRGCKIPSEKNQLLVTKAVTGLVDECIKPDLKKYMDVKLPNTAALTREELVELQPKLLELYNYGCALQRLSSMPTEVGSISQRGRLFGRTDLSGIKDKQQLRAERTKQFTQYDALVARHEEVKGLLSVCREAALNAVNYGLIDKPEELLTEEELRVMETRYFGEGSVSDKARTFLAGTVYNGLLVHRNARSRTMQSHYVQLWAAGVTKTEKKEAQKKEPSREQLDEMSDRYEAIDKKYGHEIPDLNWIILHFNELQDDFGSVGDDEELLKHSEKLLKDDEKDRRLVKLLDFFGVYGEIVTDAIPKLIAGKSMGDGSLCILDFPELKQLTERLDEARSVLEGKSIYMNEKGDAEWPTQEELDEMSEEEQMQLALELSKKEAGAEEKSDKEGV